MLTHLYPCVVAKRLVYSYHVVLADPSFCTNSKSHHIKLVLMYSRLGQLHNSVGKQQRHTSLPHVLLSHSVSCGNPPFGVGIGAQVKSNRRTVWLNLIFLGQWLANFEQVEDFQGVKSRIE